MKQEVFAGLFGGYADYRIISGLETGTRDPQPRLLVPLRAALVEKKLTARCKQLDDAVQAIEEERKGLSALTRRAQHLDDSVGHAESMVRSGDFRDAREFIDETLRDRNLETESTIRLRMLLAEVHAYFHAPGAAVEEIEQAIAIAERSGRDVEASQIRLTLIDWLSSRRDYQGAIDLASEVLLPPRRQAAMWIRRGLNQFYLGLHAEAYGSLSTALDAGADRSLCLLHRGYVLAEGGYHDLAIDELKQGLRRSTSSHFATGLAALGYCRVSVGDSRGSNDLRRAIEQESNSWIHYYRGLTFHHLNAPQEMLNAFIRSFMDSGSTDLELVHVNRLHRLLDEVRSQAKAFPQYDELLRQMITWKSDDNDVPLVIHLTPRRNRAIIGKWQEVEMKEQRD